MLRTWNMVSPFHGTDHDVSLSRAGRKTSKLCRICRPQTGKNRHRNRQEAVYFCTLPSCKGGEALSIRQGSQQEPEGARHELGAASWLLHSPLALTAVSSQSASARGPQRPVAPSPPACSSPHSPQYFWRSAAGNYDKPSPHHCPLGYCKPPPLCRLQTPAHGPGLLVMAGHPQPHRLPRQPF